MGKRGPKPTPTSVLELRGSWRAKRRKKAGLATPPKIIKRARARSIRNLEKICRTKIPGYDPWQQAGDCKFDEAAAKSAVRFFQEELTHVKGEKATQPFDLEPWQQAVIGNLFGWKRSDGTRRYREAFIFVPRKNGKTPLAAGIVLCCLFEDGEPGAEIYGAASEYKQASLVFDHASGMVRQNSELDDQSTTYRGQAKAIQLDADFSTYKVIASDSYSSHGYNTHAYVVDEVHCQPNADLIDVLETSTGARRQPLGVLISTADFERPGSVCNEKEDYAVGVRDNVIHNPAFLPVVFKASDRDDWTSRKVWEAANPNLGVSLSWEYLEAAFKKAQSLPRFENIFKRLHLNLRTEQDVRWLPMDAWDRMAAPIDLEALAGRSCWAGVDLASTTDIAGVVLVFPDYPEDGAYAVLSYPFVPREKVQEHTGKRRHHEKVSYEEWVRTGVMEATSGNVIDYDVIRKRIVELGELYDIREIAFDKWNATQLQTQLAGDGFTVSTFTQGYGSMSDPSKELERLVVDGALFHGGHEVLRWMAGNAMVETNAGGYIKPVKPKSTQKIDLVVALIMAIGRAMVREDSDDPVLVVV